MSNKIFKLELESNSKSKKFTFVLSSIFNFDKSISQLFLISYLYKIAHKVSFNLGFSYIFALLIIFFFDALFDGDEPIWEPLEWSLIQTWIIFIFLFSWIGENLITSRYGSFTGRDKRVWFAWYKSMWWIELFYIATLGVTILLIIVPFYFELTYASSFIMTFWNWFSKAFFFKSAFFLVFAILVSLVLQINIRFIFYKKILLLVFINIIILNFLFFTQFYITFFSYFTDIVWYTKNKSNDLIQLSHEPWKWGWDLESRDHFQYHSSKTVFWFKTDGPFAESFFLINLLYFVSLTFVLFFWLVLFRKVYSLNEVSYTYSLGAVSVLRQFFYFYLMFYLFILASIGIIYLKFPYEFLWLLNKSTFYEHFFLI